MNSGKIPGDSKVEGLGKALIILGVIIISTGIMILLLPRIPFIGEYLGKLPGDIHIKKKGFLSTFQSQAA